MDLVSNPVRTPFTQLNDSFLLLLPSCSQNPHRVYARASSSPISPRVLTKPASSGSLMRSCLQVPGLAGLRTGSLASEKAVSLAPNNVHNVAGTSGGAAASADILVNFTVPAAGGSFGACVLAKPPGSAPFAPHWEVLTDTNAGYDKIGVPGNKSAFLGNATDADACLALCKAKSGCQEFAWKIFGPHPPPAFLNSTLACYEIYNPDTTDPFIQPQPGATSGKFLTADPSGAGIGITITANADSTLTARVGVCAVTSEGEWQADTAADATNPAAANTFPIFADEDKVALRILPDRSVVDFFVQGGRWSGTVSWLSGTPRAANASQVSVWSQAAGVTADVDVYGMGCGWEFPSYTEHPTM